MISFFPTRTVMLTFFSLNITWYGALYVISFALAIWLLPRLQKYRGLNLPREFWFELVTWAAVGVVIGGRLGYVFFYNPSFFLAHPAEIFALWQGGMSAHGGFIGVGIALWLVAKQQKISFLKVLDLVVVPVAIGLALGRLGNLINQELYVSPLANILVISKNLLIALITYLLLRSSVRIFGPVRQIGAVASIFLIMYGSLRFLTEYWRWQDFAGIAGLTRGQLLTVPILLLGLWLWPRRA